MGILTINEADRLLGWLRADRDAAEAWIASNIPSRWWSPLERELTSHAESVVRWKESPEAFRRRLLIDVDGRGPLPLADVIADFQQANYGALDPAWDRVCGLTDEAPKWRQFYIEMAKGHSKTTDIAVQVIRALCVAKRGLWGVAAASDREQAGLVRNAILRLKELNAWLPIRVNNWEVKGTDTGSILNILASDVAGSHGQTPDFTICDEITHWKDREFFDSLYAGAGKRSTNVFVVITNAGKGVGVSWQWKVREDARNNPDDWFFVTLDGPQAPWVTDNVLRQQRRTLPPATFRRLWLNQWQSGSGDTIPEEDILACTTLAGPLKEPRSGWTYIGSADMGIRHDHAAFVVIGISPDCSRFELAECVSWKPDDFGGEIDFGVVEADIWRLCRRFGIATVYGDQTEFVYMGQRLETRVPVVLVAMGSTHVRRNMGPRLLQAFRTQRVALYHDEDLERDLRRMSIVEDPRTKTWKVDAMRSAEHGHCDRGIALALGLVYAYDWVNFDPADEETVLEGVGT